MGNCIEVLQYGKREKLHPAKGVGGNTILEYRRSVMYALRWRLLFCIGIESMGLEVVGSRLGLKVRLLIPKYMMWWRM
jgi:hypothetical protein